MLAEEPAIAQPIRDRVSALTASLLGAAARLLPAPAASRFGAAVMGTLGPRLRKHGHVLRNLHQVMPTASPAELHRAARGVWRNLGAVIAEYPHLEQIVDRRIDVIMPDAVRALFDAGRPALFVTGHLGNWEVLASYIGRREPGLVVVYSPNEDPAIERLIQRFRAPGGCEYVTKQDALRRLTPKFLGGRSVGLLPDVRVDSGPSLPLFGRDAPTTISPPRIAARLDYPMVPVRAKRLGAARFELEFRAPLRPHPDHIGKRAAVDLMRQFNGVLEDWISERPDEWLCTKRRWPKRPAPC